MTLSVLQNCSMGEQIETETNNNKDEQNVRW
jgi:hypothetical protein